MSSNGHRYNVGGILLERPFKIRRLGHFGFNITKLEEARHFYGDLLGFTVSDKADFSRRAVVSRRMPGSATCHGYFMRYGTDHHAMVLFSKPVMDQRADRKFAPEVTINQITWQCGSLKEIVEAYGYFQEQQVRIQRVGRDMPGSNWHTYVYDPDGHTNELYYGIEQVGWNQDSKPRAMYYRGFREKPELPQMSEAAEVADGAGQGHRHLLRPPPGAAERRHDLRRRRRPAAAPVQDHQDRPGAAVRRRRRPRRGLLHAPSRADEERGERCTAAPAASSCAPAPSTTASRSTRRNCAASSASARTRPACRSASSWRTTRSCARRSRFLKAQGCTLDRPAAGALSRHRLRRLRARPGRPLHPALLLHGADRLGRPLRPAAERRPVATPGPRRWSRSPTPTSTRSSRARSAEIE